MNATFYDAWYDTARGRWIGVAEFRLLSRLLQARPGDTLLDVGCGTGWFTRRFAEEGLLASGLDPNPDWLAFAQIKGPPATRWILGDARALPFPDRRFDRVVSVAALCIVEYERQAVAEIVRVTRRRFAIDWLNRMSLLYRQKGRGGGSGAYRGARWALLGFGLVVIALALILLLWIQDTIHWVHAEHAQNQQRAGTPVLAPKASAWETFVRVSFRDVTYRALCQGGVANKVADTLVWVLFPVFFRLHGLGVVRIGWITGVYAMIWGLSQLWTGHLADRIGRKPPVVLGFSLLAAGLAGTALVSGFRGWIITAAVMGLGMALLYPNLIAAISDVAPPLERGRILGTYRYWRDTGYAIGGLLLGLVAQWSDEILPAIWLTAAIVALSGLWIALAVKETHPRPG